MSHHTRVSCSPWQQTGSPVGRHTTLLHHRHGHHPPPSQPERESMCDYLSDELHSTTTRPLVLLSVMSLFKPEPQQTFGGKKLKCPLCPNKCCHCIKQTKCAHFPRFSNISSVINDVLTIQMFHNYPNFKNIPYFLNYKKCSFLYVLKCKKCPFSFLKMSFIIVQTQKGSKIVLIFQHFPLSSQKMFPAFQNCPHLNYLYPLLSKTS